MKQLLKRQGVRCTTAATALPTITALLLGWALVEEESALVRQALREAMQCQEQVLKAGSEPQEPAQGGEWQDEHHDPLSEWMLAEISMDLVCQQIREHYTTARYHVCCHACNASSAVGLANGLITTASSVAGWPPPLLGVY